MSVTQVLLHHGGVGGFSLCGRGHWRYINYRDKRDCSAWGDAGLKARNHTKYLKGALRWVRANKRLVGARTP